MKTAYIIILLLVAIILLSIINKKQENAIFCKPPGTQLFPDTSGNYASQFCCSGEIDAEHKCKCLPSGKNINLYKNIKQEDCCNNTPVTSEICM